MRERQPEILVIQTAFLGDLLLSIPLFKELRRSEPSARLTVYCRKGLGGFMLESGLVDDVVEADKTSPESLAQAEQRLASREYSLIICPHESFRSALLTRKLKGALKIGYSRWFNRWIFDKRVERPLALPEALRQLALLAPVEPAWGERLASWQRAQGKVGGQLRSGGETSSSELMPVPDWASMVVPKLVRLREEYRRIGEIPQGASERVRTIASRIGFCGARLAILAPGSVWPTKQWTAEGYASVAQEFLKRGYKVVLTGSPDEKPLCEKVAERAPGAFSVAGETALWESAELLAFADILICNDSGAMHMAAVSNVPTVSVFGPTILDFGYRPWQNFAKVVEVPRSELKCRPCGSHGSKACPIGTHACMKQVSPAQVLEAGDRLTTSLR